MILGFKTHWNGKPTHFPEKIMACTMPAYRENYRPKLHTIRAGDRWKPGMELHMATGVRTKNYKRFNAGAVGLRYCLRVQKFEIYRMDDFDKSRLPDGKYFEYILNIRVSTFVIPFMVKVDGKFLETASIHQLALNDGFESANEMFEWFNLLTFTGQIIHWTTLRY